MPKMTVQSFGSVDIKLDVGAYDSYDKKRPHVSIYKHGDPLYEHVYLDQVDGLVGNDSDEKKAIYWLRDNKDYLTEQYNKLNH